MSNTNGFKDVQKYLDNKAIVLDVRTKAEYIEGHLEHSLHIVLDELKGEISQLKSLQRPIITCFRSGARSEIAKNLLKENDIDVINGGPWESVEYFFKKNIK